MPERTGDTNNFAGKMKMCNFVVINQRSDSMKTRYILAAVVVAVCVMANAQKRKAKLSPAFVQAKELVDKGDYVKATPILRELADKEPKNASVNALAGLSLLRSGNPAQAKRYLDRGGNDGKLYLAEMNFDAYRFEEALELLENYEAAQTKAKKPVDPLYESLLAKVQTGTSMLDRVEDIVIVDSLTVDKDKFFRYYRLSEPSGRIADASVLQRDFKASPGATVYITENGETMIWPELSDGHTQLVQSTMLADGSWERPVSLGEDLALGGDALFPYLMSDGITLYYASNGEGSLGGYDIFITRNNGDKYLQPQNVGMPYNSPANDYMLAIDELTGAGWWATDRHAPEGKVTVYIYIPRDVRKNYPVDNPELVSLAKVNSIAATREPGEDYSNVIKRINAITPQTGDRKEDFAFALPTGKICRRMGDLRTVEGRRAMKTYLLLAAELETMMQNTAKLRELYAAGDVSASGKILDNEAREMELRDELRASAGEIVRAECPDMF